MCICRNLLHFCYSKKAPWSSRSVCLILESSIETLTNNVDRHIEKLRKNPPALANQGEDSTHLPHLESLGLATANVIVEHLCPLPVLQMIVNDYLDEIYPIAPIIHIPSFKSQFSASKYTTDPVFLRLCLSICAMTIASRPKSIDAYGFGHYLAAKEMVSRACQLVTASRVATASEWADEPTSNELICSLLLGTASHYTDSPRRGWVYINESIHCSRNLSLCNPEGYEGMSVLSREINKRAFWMLYIVQM
jgi:hypothetical protein